MMRRVAVVACALGFAFHVTACGRITRNVRVVADRPSNVNELWQEPSDIQQRELREAEVEFAKAAPTVQEVEFAA
jgi:hypothetical protein